MSQKQIAPRSKVARTTSRTPTPEKIDQIDHRSLIAKLKAGSNIDKLISAQKILSTLAKDSDSWIQQNVKQFQVLLVHMHQQKILIQVLQ
ncbi:MAG: hypothetical protein EZS28_012546 [Streblomastix strix]|uniref:Uncharacterized protein n=1 Tax=Streblomastix strix TaxID=222440 RepID=A0A5J4WAX8_9EUKA|nr:MAG: hypothetical protein EZS28_012546 [Streblomastix strix]